MGARAWIVGRTAEDRLMYRQTIHQSDNVWKWISENEMKKKHKCINEAEPDTESTLLPPLSEPALPACSAGDVRRVEPSVAAVLPISSSLPGAEAVVSDRWLPTSREPPMEPPYNKRHGGVMKTATIWIDKHMTESSFSQYEAHALSAFSMLYFDPFMRDMASNKS